MSCLVTSTKPNWKDLTGVELNRKHCAQNRLLLSVSLFPTEEEEPLIAVASVANHIAAVVEAAKAETN